MLEVAAAFIRDGERFMVCQRPAGKAREFLWEFPGGKLEPGETAEEAIVRECEEELCITLEAKRRVARTEYEYPDVAVGLTLVECAIKRGTPKLLEHMDVRWITEAETKLLQFCPADRLLIEQLSKNGIIKEARMIVSNETILQRLFELRDEEYRAFHCRLMPTIAPENVIGVRTPELRRYAKELFGTPEAEVFLNSLPHRYYDENNLHSFLLERIKDYDSLIVKLDEFLPHIDNWATCDVLRPKAFAKYPAGLERKLEEWVTSDYTYTIRFGVEMLMRFYLDERFAPEYPELISRVRSTEYYVNMMIAWYFATALAKQYDAIIPYIEERRLDAWTHNKAIQKSIESYRITDGQKAYLRGLRIKS